MAGRPHSLSDNERHAFAYRAALELASPDLGVMLRAGKELALLSGFKEEEAEAATWRWVERWIRKARKV